MFETREILNSELANLLGRRESHYLDFKAKEIDGRKLQRHLVALANADGGELWVGISQADNGFVADGFLEEEDANQLVQAALLNIKPSIDGLVLGFAQTPSAGILVQFIVPKSGQVHHTSSGDCFIRMSAQTQRIKGNDVALLGFSKGFLKYEESRAPAASLNDILSGSHLANFLARVGSKQEPRRFLSRNRLIVPASDVPNVGCVLLFDDEPDAVLSTKAAVRIVRMRTTSEEYDRSQMTSHDKLVGPLESLVQEAEAKILELMSNASFEVDGVSFSVSYPAEAVHEVLVNAFLHRDYSISDDIVVTVFDNRIEVRSPGGLPGTVTEANILDAHFARNPNIVRLLNKLPDAMNHDLGEGLNTAFRAMNQAGLIAPVVQDSDGKVTVTLRHKKIASYEELILEYLDANEWITNRIARGLTGEGSENKVKSALQRLRKKGLIEPEDPEASRFKFRYRRVLTD